MIQVSDNLFLLETEHSAYQMKVNERGMLEHLWYGARVDQNMDYLNLHNDLGFSGQIYEDQADRTLSPDTLMLEYPTEGIGDYRITAAKVEGALGLDLRYAGYEISTGEFNLDGLPHVRGELEQLTIHLKDEVLNLQVDLHYLVDEKHDAIVRWATFRNKANRSYRLDRSFGMALDFPVSEDVELISFPGRHNKERIMTRQPLAQNVVCFGSKRGTSSHQHNPSLIVCDSLTTENYGDAYGFLMVYSGSFKIEVEKDQTGQTRVLCGISPDMTRWTLDAHASFETPQTILFYSSQGLGKLSRNSHDLLRERILPKNDYHPILINTWEAVMFDFNREKLLEMADHAAKLDVDLYVMDDGWFGKRNSDLAGLGDWIPNEAKLGGSLNSLIEEINARGMDFGIWIEPEMINENSDLYRAHPEWVLHAPNRKPLISRGQMVLDLCNPDVVDYLENQFTRLLSSGNIRYVKWDMNRSLGDVYAPSLPIEKQEEVCHRYILGVYDLLGRLTSKFSNILFEGCSGGGGRFDAGMLFYTPQIWCSDDTDVHERSKIQYGTSFFYPAASMGAHVSEVPNQQTGRWASLESRAAMAMAGTYGYELDPGEMSEEEKAEIRALNKQFRSIQDLIVDGDVYRLSAPKNEQVIFQFMDKTKERLVLLGIVYETRPSTMRRKIRLQNLPEEAVYKTQDGTLYSAKALMHAGLLLDQTCGTDAPVHIELKRIR